MRIPDLEIEPSMEIRRGEPRDERAVRRFYERFAGKGSLPFAAVSPFKSLHRTGTLPRSALWIADDGLDIMAVGWRDDLAADAVRVVALEHALSTQWIDPMLKSIQKELQAITAARTPAPQITAYLPAGNDTLPQAYLRHGWTYTEPTWTLWLDDVIIERAKLQGIVAEALAAGLIITPMPGDAELHLTGLASPSIPHHLRHRLEAQYVMYDGGTPLAMNAVNAAAQGRRELSIVPLWQGARPLSQLERKVLAAAVLLHVGRLPDVVTGSEAVGACHAWFRGHVKIDMHGGFTLKLDPTRAPGRRDAL